MCTKGRPCGLSGVLPVAVRRRHTPPPASTFVLRTPFLSGSGAFQMRFAVVCAVDGGHGGDLHMDGLGDDTRRRQRRGVPLHPGQ